MASITGINGPSLRLWRLPPHLTWKRQKTARLRYRFSTQIENSCCLALAPEYREPSEDTPLLSKLNSVSGVLAPPRPDDESPAQARLL
jgi:hypothetical protein